MFQACFQATELITLNIVLQSSFARWWKKCEGGSNVVNHTVYQSFFLSLSSRRNIYSYILTPKVKTCNQI